MFTDWFLTMSGGIFKKLPNQHAHSDPSLCFYQDAFGGSKLGNPRAWVREASLLFNILGRLFSVGISLQTLGLVHYVVGLSHDGELWLGRSTYWEQGGKLSLSGQRRVNYQPDMMVEWG